MICRSCGSEVSPYITECPYCGNRLRKRAPKLDRHGRVAEKRRRRSPGPSLPRLRRGEIPGIRGEARPYASGVLVLLGMAGYLVWRVGGLDIYQLTIDGDKPGSSLVAPDHRPIHLQQPWVCVRRPRRDRGIRLAARAAPRTAARAGAVRDRRRRRHCGNRGGVQLPERPRGQRSGAGAADGVGDPDLIALRRRQDIDGDLLGAVLIAVVVALMPLVVEAPAPSWVSDGVGILGGLAIGLPLALAQDA